MGKFSPFVNFWACAWTLFVSIIFVLPTARPVVANEMNYASAFLGLIALFAGLFWLMWGKKRYVGPVIEAMRGDADSGTGSGSEGVLDGEKGSEKAKDGEVVR